jgi:hypothetical protein
MPRITLDLDSAVLRELKRREPASGQTLGQLASELLVSALKEPPSERQGIRWRSARMGARVDVDDKEAIRRAIDGT